MLTLEGIENCRRIAKAINDKHEKERERREFWDGFAMWLACVIFAPCYVVMVFAFSH